ncbi:MAG: ribose-5-phosphate isomerase RpiA [Bacteroidota bacterium]|nr:ribose-5-phosphate isomerase RpiA [Bacteroidota bacterium]
MSNQQKQDLEKKSAAEKAAEYVKDGMVVGLGSGSTVFFAIKKLGELAKTGLKFKAVSTSDTTTQIAQSAGLNVVSIDEVNEIDLTIDGADEIDKDLNGIKGGGGALLFEKIVALSSKKNIWIVDSSKMVEKLGNFPLPAEVIPFGYKRALRKIEDMNLQPVIRKKENDFYYTDSGNYIFDLKTGRIDNLQKLNDEIKLITGVVETGLFIDIAQIVIVAKNNGIEILNK